jgi:hypothetical protein
MGAEDMFVNLERDVCNDHGGGISYIYGNKFGWLYTQGVRCGRQAARGPRVALQSTSRCLWDDENTVSGRILPRGRLESALCDT